MAYVIAFVAFFAPLALWAWWRKTERLIYQGRATLHPATKSIGTSPGRHCYTAVALPGYREWLLAEISRARAEGLPDIEMTVDALRAAHLVNVDVVVAQRAFGKPFVKSLTWLDGAKETDSFDAQEAELGAIVFYFVGGMIALVLQAVLFAGMFFIAAGFIAGDRTIRGKELHAGNRVSLGIMTAILGAACVALFSQPFGLVTLLGAVIAIAFGQVVAMLVGGKRV